MEWNEEAQGGDHICQAHQQEETKNRTENQRMEIVGLLNVEGTWRKVGDVAVFPGLGL